MPCVNIFVPPIIHSETRKEHHFRPQEKTEPKAGGSATSDPEYRESKSFYGANIALGKLHFRTNSNAITEGDFPGFERNRPTGIRKCSCRKVGYTVSKSWPLATVRSKQILPRDTLTLGLWTLTDALCWSEKGFGGSNSIYSISTHFRSEL